jgi:hypothetical protein
MKIGLVIREQMQIQQEQLFGHLYILMLILLLILPIQIRLELQEQVVILGRYLLMELKEVQQLQIQEFIEVSGFQTGATLI